jgi:hypothetical protein
MDLIKILAGVGLIALGVSMIGSFDTPVGGLLIVAGGIILLWGLVENHQRHQNIPDSQIGTPGGTYGPSGEFDKQRSAPHTPDSQESSTRLKNLEKLKKEGLLSAEEYESKRNEIINSL